MQLEDVLPQLAAAYEQGRLVPFLGAGMSRPACRDWPGFIQHLEAEAGRRRGVTGAGTSEDLTRRAEWAVRAIRFGKPASWSRAVLRALYHSRWLIPEQTTALARLDWPLVLTTNYDDCFLRAREAVWGRGPRPPHMLVLGRGLHHCSRVLSSLHRPSNPILWSLQGFVGRESGKLFYRPEPLDEELVIGHEEYRRVTNLQPHFRRAFAEVYRSRSLLFLGAGLRDAYLLSLFGEILETFGPNPYPHYAIVPKGEVDARFLLRAFNAIVIEYPAGRHRDVTRLLGGLAGHVDRVGFTQRSWRFQRDGRSSVEVRVGPLPLPADGECVALPASVRTRASPDGRFGEFVQEAKTRGLITSLARLREMKSMCIYRAEGSRSAGAVLFLETNSGIPYFEDFMSVQRAVEDLLDVAVKRLRFGDVHVPLLSPNPHNPGFTTYFGFAATLRGFGVWCKRNPSRGVRLVVHTTDGSVLRDLTGGRVDTSQLVAGDSRVPLWVEVTGPSRLERHWQLRSMRSTVLEIAKDFDVDGQGWVASVDPAPGSWGVPNDWGDREVYREPLQYIGVMPGSVLRFTYEARRRRRDAVRPTETKSVPPPASRE